MKKIISIVLAVLALISIFSFCGCYSFEGIRENDKVSYNISKEADNFNVTRKITVINTRTDTIIYEFVGTFSMENSSTNELAIICKVGESSYKKHYIYLNSNITYTVVDISGSEVSPYYWEITYYPQAKKIIDISSDNPYKVGNSVASVEEETSEYIYSTNNE